MVYIEKPDSGYVQCRWKAVIQRDSGYVQAILAIIMYNKGKDSICTVCTMNDIRCPRNRDASKHLSMVLRGFHAP